METPRSYVRDKRSPPTTAQRSRVMSTIRAKDTKPELLVRHALHRAGLRFRLHKKDLPGRPDLVLPKYGTAIFVHGCFWHGHNCRPQKNPKTNTKFWTDKITRNIERDARKAKELKQAGWKVITIWACDLNEQTLMRLIKKIKVVDRSIP